MSRMGQRTCNRVREHGEHWQLKESRSWVQCLDGPADLMVCPPTCGWFGWIPEGVRDEQSAVT
jgi:hypothetical protein